MTTPIQTRASHRRFIPAWHFFVLPILGINVVVTAVRLARAPSLGNAWVVIVAIALLLGIFFSRSMPLRAQDRVIRLEEQLRLDRILPPDLRARIDELTPEQFIGLRFAPDEEVSELTGRSLSGELKTRTDIKRAIQNWRADHFRV
ncbi:MAG TPA: DUF6526 family protein [Gemmatimonadaceae bacterium]|jgi:hypothetical protein|nr:DUF6526 family protein [Gemmatimonadaceae bacterium]